MSSRYGGITGSKQISEDFQNINSAFENVEKDMDANKTKIDDHVDSTTAHKSEHITYTGQVLGANVKEALNQINQMIDVVGGRIDGIVAQSGNDNTEIVDARDGFPVLSARLDSMDRAMEGIGLNVKTLGAQGDGVSNETTAFQSAVDSPLVSTVYIPAGTYLIDEIVVSKKIRIILHQNARLVLRSTTVYEGDIGCIFRFMNSASGSILEGGILDGNRSVLEPLHSNNSLDHLVAIHTSRCNDIIIRDLIIQDTVTFAVFHGGHNALYENVVMKNCGKGIYCGISDDCTWRNIKQYDIGNINLDIWMHANELSLLKNCTFDNWKIYNYKPTSRNLDPVPEAFSCENLVDCTITNIVIDGFMGVAGRGSNFKDCMGFWLSGLQNTHLSKIRVYGYSVGLEIHTAEDSTLSDFIIDNQYFEGTNNFSVGLRILAAGIYYQTPDTPNLVYASASGHGFKAINGIIKRCTNGMYLQAGNAEIVNVKFTANQFRGLHIVNFNTNSDKFPNLIVPTPENIKLSSCVFSFNGESGLVLEEADNVDITGCTFFNNGQDSSNVSENRVGLLTLGSKIKRNINLTGGSVFDNQAKDFNKSMSFLPGSTTNNRMVMVCNQADVLNEGQYIDLENASNNNTVKVKVVDKDFDYVTVETATPVTFTEYGNLTALSGNVTSNGKTVTGIGTAFTTEIKGPLYVKFINSGEYGLVEQVVSDTEFKLVEALKTPVTNSAASKLGVTMWFKQSQEFGLHITGETLNTSYFTTLYGHRKRDVLFNAFWSFAPGQKIIIQQDKTYSQPFNTTGSLTTISELSNIPSDVDVISYSFKVTETAGGSDGTISIVCIDANAVETTLVSGLSRNVNTVSNGRLTIPTNVSTPYKIAVKISGGSDNIPDGGTFQLKLLAEKKYLFET